MKVFHTTDATAQILSDGFQDVTGTYLTLNEYTGVWFADQPLGVNEGVTGLTVLELEIPEQLFVEFEWVEEGKPYREALIPAASVNAFRDSLRVVPQDELASRSNDLL